MAKFFGSKKSFRSIVVCLRGEISASAFTDVQTFVAVEVNYLLLFTFNLFFNFPFLSRNLILDMESAVRERAIPSQFKARKDVSYWLSTQKVKMDRLPPELLLQIADCLSGRDLVALSGSCSAISEVLSQERRLWRRHLDKIKVPGTR